MEGQQSTPFDWDEIPIVIPDDYKNYIGCKIIPVSNNVLEIHAIKLCANKIQAGIKQHVIKKLDCRETVEKKVGEFSVPTQESRQIKVCYTCLLKTRFFCRKQLGRGREIRECMTYINWWDSLAKTVKRKTQQ